MDIEVIRDYALRKPSAMEGFPFGEDVLVFKVKGKMFLLISLSSQPLQFNAKCNPDRAIELRETYPDLILPGYHMNKKHWNSIVVTGVLNKKLIFEMIDESYDLVAGKKKK